MLKLKEAYFRDHKLTLVSNVVVVLLLSIPFCFVIYAAVCLLY